MPDLSFFVRSERRQRTRRLRVLPFLALAALLVGACSDDDDDPTPPAGTGRIEGSVTADGAGVPDAQVALTGAAVRTVTTDDAGAYAFTQLGPGQYTVTVTLPAGYTLTDGQTASRMVTLATGGTEIVNWTAETDATAQVVTLSANAFNPATITIDPGTTVRWVVGVGTHTVTPDDADQPGAWEGTGSLNEGNVFEYTFMESGQTYPYHCVFHRATGMTGTVVVR